MSIRTGLKGGVSLSAFAVALGAAALPHAAFAQTTQPSTPVETEEPEDEAAQPVDTDDTPAIIVSGFRESLKTAVSEKRRNNLILESVTAEDIGKLPDNSIGESIARLPGVTSQRLNGRANVIAIRGFGPDFSQTLLNGREQTSTGDNRAVEFDQYPGEVVNQVVVYKTPSAELVGQGLVGTIDVRTIRPLDAGERVFAVGVKGSYADIGALNEGSKEFGYRVNATYVDQFADDTIGVALSASYTDEPYQLQEFNAWGYAGNGTTANPYVIGGSKSYVTSTQLKRFGATATVQARMSDRVTLTADGFYSNFDDDQIKRGIELPLGFLAFGTQFNPATADIIQVPAGAFAQGGTFTNVEGVVRNDVFQRQADQYAGGLNLLYEGDDGFTAFADFGYSRTDRNELSIESYSGTGYNVGVGATDTIQFRSDENGTSFTPTLNYSDPNLIRLTDPLGWGGSRVQAGYYNNRIIRDELFQYRIGVSKSLESFFDAIKVGFNYTNRDKSLTPDEFFVMPAGGATSIAIPSALLLRSTDLGYLGLGPIVSYDPRAVIASGALILDRNTSNDIPAKAFRVSEDLLTGYVQLDIDQRLGSGDLTGNIGVQAVSTVQQSSGLAFANGTQVAVSLGDDYWDVLPSANLALRLDSGWVFRLAASRQIQRPRLDDLRSAIGYGINNNVAESPTGLAPFISGGGGNPLLRPYRANGFDAAVERYFANGEGVVALQVFYKDIVEYIDRARFVFDYSPFPVPAGPTPATTIGLLDAPTNTGGGNFYGAELSLTLPFSIFTNALDGFGATGGVGYTDSQVENANGDEAVIPGYSEWVANGTVYFEKWGFNARTSVRYRSEFLGDFTGFGGSPTRRRARSEMIVDAQLGYDFPDTSALSGLSIYVQGQNLTDEPFVSQFDVDEPRAVIDYQTYGRRFLAGATFRF